MGPIAVFGGTSEGKELAIRLLETNERVVLFVATDLGARVAVEGLSHSGRRNLSVRSGRLNSSEVRRNLEQAGIRAVVDATHPFATEISRNIRAAVQALAIPMLTLGREPAARPGGLDIVRVPDIPAAARLATDLGKKCLLAIGAGGVAKFVPEFGGPLELLYGRVAPDPASIETCLDAGLPAARIVAAQGPFSTEFNKACLRFFGAETLVTKDSGKRGGLEQKFSAAAQLGAKVILVEAPDSSTGSVTDVEQAIAWIRGL